MKVIQDVEDLKVGEKYFVHAENQVLLWSKYEILGLEKEGFLVSIDEAQPTFIKKDFLVDKVKIHLDGKEFELPSKERIAEMQAKDKKTLGRMLKTGGLIVGGLALAVFVKGRK